MRNFIQYILPLLLVVVLVVNIFFPDPQDLELNEQLEVYSSLSNDNKRNKKLNEVYFQLLKQDSFNLDFHFHFLITHFNQPKKEVNWKGSFDYRDDNKIVNNYRNLSYNINDSLKDIGYLGLGVSYHFLRIYDESGRYLNEIKNRNLKYLNYIHGGRYFYYDFPKSEKYYKEEIRLYPDEELSIEQLGALYVQNEKFQKLDSLVNIEEYEEHVNLKNKRILFYKTNQGLRYVQTIVNRLLLVVNVPGLIGALSILLIWVLYLTRIHKQVLKEWPRILFMILMGASFAFLTSVLTDYFRHTLGFKLHEGILNDLIYCIVGIGLIEELVKVLPFLLFLYFSKSLKEPIDYIIFSSFSALGFAFLENLIYFDQGGLVTLQGRALTATVFHMFTTSLVTYGIIIGKFSKKKNTLLYFLGFLTLAALVHGVYDFWLINSVAKKFHTITFVMLLISLILWNSIINNCLNNSFNEDIPWGYKPYKLNRFLLFSLSFVFVLEYVFVAYLFGSEEANSGLWQDFAQGLFLLVFLTINLSKFDYIPKYWAPLKLWDWDIFLNIPKINPKFFDLNKILGAKVELNTFGEFGVLKDVFPLKGQIVSRHLISWEKDWYLVKLDKEVKVGLRKRRFLLVKCRRDNEIILENPDQVVQVRQVNSLNNLSNKRKLKREFLFVDLAKITRI